ncbi:MOS1T transposase, partial [Pseudoatta argentina]
MEKNEFRAMIKHLHMKGLTPKEIKAKLDKLFHDNARIHTCPEPMLPHPAYSPDLALYDYFLFPNLKKRFITREQLIAETETYFEELDKSYYSDGLKKLENRWIKCIELKGDYVEK